MLDMSMRCLQVCWEGSTIACFILFVFCLQGGCSWPNSSTPFGLVHPHPLQYCCGGLTSGHKLPSQSSSASKVERSELSRT